MKPEQLDQLLTTLLALPKESEWVEFKHNNTNVVEIGEYISALANSAALLGKDEAYLVWGVEDLSHRVLGTTFKPRQSKKGNEELENWLAHSLVPSAEFSIHEWAHHGLPMVVVQIRPACSAPVRFQDTEWIRVGSYKKKLKDYPAKEKELWAALAKLAFEKGIAAANVTGDEVLALLDYPKFFELSAQNLPTNRAGILERLVVDRLIGPRAKDQFDITNLGAILFAKQLSAFDGLSRKALRVIRYKGNNRVATEREKLENRGYAASFAEIIGYIHDQLPQNEVLGEALRSEVRMYPRLAIRELVANALIHQDFSIAGTGPMVEIFDDRLEVSNPGLPLIDTLRFIDHAPRSRNEILADLMRRLSVCEERGSGIDKVIFEIEVFQLPPPDFRTDTTHTRAVLFAHQNFQKMDKKDKMRACYQHCCLLCVSNRVMTNTTLRERFKIAEGDYPVASRIIRETVTAKLIKLDDPNNKSRKHARYVPFWA